MASVPGAKRAAALTEQGAASLIQNEWRKRGSKPGASPGEASLGEKPSSHRMAAGRSTLPEKPTSNRMRKSEEVPREEPECLNAHRAEGDAGAGTGKPDGGGGGRAGRLQAAGGQSDLQADEGEGGEQGAEKEGGVPH